MFDACRGGWFRGGPWCRVVSRTMDHTGQRSGLVVPAKVQGLDGSWNKGFTVFPVGGLARSGRYGRGSGILGIQLLHQLQQVLFHQLDGGFQLVVHRGPRVQLFGAVRTAVAQVQ